MLAPAVMPGSSLAGGLHQRSTDGQRIAALGNGTFLNPVLSGDRADPNVLRDGEDYYAVFSSFAYYPGVPIWHSRDLVSWRPLAAALRVPLGSVYALDIAKHDGRYFIYIPVIAGAGFNADAKEPSVRIYAITAPAMAGPWSDPVDMDITGHIDPGHAVGEDGHRYLFLNDGARVRISDDGLHRAGPVEQVYHGWPIPEDWIVEAVALEGPKILRRDGWYYMFTAQGGTAGPPTSHMVIIARARSIDGPWINHPDNPIVRTASANEPWWSRGHATPIEGPDGRWWMSYHGYENGYRTLGRQMLLDRLEWGVDGWPRASGGDVGAPMPLPQPGAALPPPALSGPITADRIGTIFQFFSPQPGYLDRIGFTDDTAILAGLGTGPGDSSPLALIAGDRAYRISITIDLDGAVEAGLLLFYNEALFTGVGLDADGLHGYALGEPAYLGRPSAGGRRFAVRLDYQDQVATFHAAIDGGGWRKIASFEVSGYHHNMAGGFLSLRPAIYAANSGRATFGPLHYEGLA